MGFAYAVLATTAERRGNEMDVLASAEEMRSAVRAHSEARHKEILWR